MKRLTIGFVLFPKVTQLDFTGPLQVLTKLPGARIHIVAKTMDTVPSDGVLSIPPTVTFADCPDLDMICVPGGAGVADAILDEETVDFVRRQGANATYVTSVCTGAFLLGAAGLLKGHKATSHWGYTGLLPLVGATHVKDRVVRDGNLFTAGGVTSGIDFGLTIFAEIAGEEAARAVQLGIEYNPAPPIDSGHPDKATGPVKDKVAPYYEKMVETYRERLQGRMNA
jgi:cyclohexyl-isocyanide hydratase